VAKGTQPKKRATPRRKAFIHDDFLLESRQARKLFHDYAEDLPIIDYHCHLDPKSIAEDRRFLTITEPWLEGDHYKWRAMRTCGVEERFITGDATAWEKFQKWAETVPRTLRNPLYHWTHLELRQPFGITNRLLGPDTARSIWEDCNALLAKPGFSTRGILKRMKVEVVCTTDDPADSLVHHRAIASDPTMTTAVYPAFRPDKAMAVDDPVTYKAYLARLGAAAETEINSYDALLEALKKRHTFFHEQGCRLSDHGLDEVYAEEYTTSEARALFAIVRAGKALDIQGVRRLKSALLHELAVMDAERGWVQQYHLGALRNNNTRMMRTLGPDTGFDSIDDRPMARPIARFMDRLDDKEQLARTILYNINPADNELMATMIGNFQDGSVPGKIQFGAAWWFLDQRDGMVRQLEALSAMGLLGQFVGMLTDSRSFLSFPRHEYFRRLLCGLLGDDMARGVLPDDLSLAGALVQDVCYHNARRYFPFPCYAASGAAPSRSSHPRGRRS
jgi:glucuronate isomerase